MIKTVKAKDLNVGDIVIIEEEKFDVIEVNPIFAYGRGNQHKVFIKISNQRLSKYREFSSIALVDTVIML